MHAGHSPAFLDLHDLLVDEAGNRAHAFPFDGTGLDFGWKQAHLELEGTSEGDVTGAEALVPQMGEEHGPEVGGGLTEGPEGSGEAFGLTGEALSEVFKEVCDLVLEPPET